MQVKKIIAVLLTVCLLFSLSVSASAVDELYNIADDVVPAPLIYYTDGYYPGAVAEMRNVSMFAYRIAHGSYSAYNYNPHWIYRQGHDALGYDYFTGDFNALTPFVTADQTDVSGIYMVDKTTLLSGNMLIFYLPSTSDAYFDFQSSNFVFDQQSPQANTFYIDGDLTFSLRNLWSISGTQGSDSFYLASDPLAVQLVIDGKPYGDIIDVTGYTSPFTALYNGGIPSNATVTFNNMKVYYQGDTPDMIGFRVYTGSFFTDGQYNYNNAGDFVGVDVENSITLRCSEIPDITFVQEGGDGYAGDLSGISGLLSQILSGLSGLRSLMFDSATNRSWLQRIHEYLTTAAGENYLNHSGGVSSFGGSASISVVLQRGLLGLRSLMVDSSTNRSWFQRIHEYMTTAEGENYLNSSGGVSSFGGAASISVVLQRGLLGLAALEKNAQSYVADTVFPWQSYNLQTHQLNTATNITGQNNLFLTAFQSMEDKLGRLAYVFGSDEDLALKDSADPGTDAFRENFGGGASLKDIGDAAELTTSVPQLMDSGFDFGDGLEEIATNDSFLAWFSAETRAALDSTGNVAAADDDYLADYYDNLRRVEEKRHWGD